MVAMNTRVQGFPPLGVLPRRRGEMLGTVCAGGAVTRAASAIRIWLMAIVGKNCQRRGRQVVVSKYVSQHESMVFIRQTIWTRHRGRREWEVHVACVSQDDRPSAYLSTRTTIPPSAESGNRSDTQHLNTQDMLYSIQLSTCSLPMLRACAAPP